MPDRLQEIRARLDAATPGPWHVHPVGSIEVRRLDYSGFVVARANHDDDADLIAHAPADLAWLLAEIDALRERVAVLRVEVTDLEDIVRGAGGAGA